MARKAALAWAVRGRCPSELPAERTWESGAGERQNFGSEQHIEKSPWYSH